MNNKFFQIVAVAILITLLGSCVSLQDREVTANERAGMQVIGSVEVQFNSHQFFHIPNKNRLKNKAYSELLRAAQMRYEGNIDIINISITGSWNNWNLLTIPLELFGGYYSGLFVAYGIYENYPLPAFLFLGVGLVGLTGTGLIGNVQRITAKGDVILLDGETGRTALQRLDTQINQRGLDGAIARASETLIEELPRDTTIAILNINASNISEAEHVIDMLEFRFVQSRRFRVVDRHRLEQVRREQNFQLSGDVDDSSAVSIGNMLGANIVITGNVRNNRLVLRVLDVQTAQIITMALEQF